MKQAHKILALFVLFSTIAFATGWVLRSVGAAAVQQESVRQEETLEEDEAAGGGATTWAIPFAICLSVGLSCVAAGYAVGRVGSAAIGAISEKPELFGRSLIFVGLAEGIAIYGLLIGILLWTKM